MDKELDKRLVEEFPNLYKNRNASPQTTCMCWGFTCGDGWFELIYDLSSKLEDLILQLPESEKQECAAAQCKEKFGGLRFYIDGATEEMHDLISEAEDLSFHICEFCGAKGKRENLKGWITTVCEEHAKDPSKKIKAPSLVSLQDLRVLIEKDKNK